VHSYDKDQAETLDILREFRATLAPYNGLLLGEVDSEDAAGKAAYYYGGDGSALHLAFNNDQIELAWSARDFYRSFEGWQKLVPQQGWPTITFSNHDRVRSMSRYGNDPRKAGIMLTLLMTMRGTPILYYGEELGMEEATIAPENIKDQAYFAAKLPGPLSRFSWPGRDGCRTPMQWTPNPGGGFSAAPPWLVATRPNLSFNVEDEETKPRSLLNLYRNLRLLRANSEALSTGTIEFMTQQLDSGIFAYKRRASHEQFLVVLNFNEHAQSFVLPDKDKWEVRSGKDGVLSSPQHEATHMYKLAPYAALVLARK
jgi:alpha-glucosidase